MTGGQRNDGDLLSQIHIAMIRLDSKLDGLIQQVNNIVETQRDHEIRLRSLELKPHVDPQRVVKLEDKEYVTTAGVWRVVGAVVGIVSVLATVIIAIVTK